MVAHPNRSAVEHRSPEPLCDAAKLLANRLEGLPLDERLDLRGCRGLIESGFESFTDLGALLVVESREFVNLDLNRALARLHVAGHADDVADFDIGVRADAGLLEGCGRNDTGTVTQLEQRRTAGLLDTDDLALDMDCLSDRLGEIGDADVLAVAHLDGDRVGRVGLVEG